VSIELESQEEVDAMYLSMRTIYNQGVCRMGQRSQAKSIMDFLKPQISDGLRQELKDEQ
jgi:hypothetical protein